MLRPLWVRTTPIPGLTPSRQALPAPASLSFLLLKLEVPLSSLGNTPPHPRELSVLGCGRLE